MRIFRVQKSHRHHFFFIKLTMIWYLSLFLVNYLQTPTVAVFIESYEVTSFIHAEDETSEGWHRTEVDFFRDTVPPQDSIEVREAQAVETETVKEAADEKEQEISGQHPEDMDEQEKNGTPQEPTSEETMSNKDSEGDRTDEEGF